MSKTKEELNALKEVTGGTWKPEFIINEGCFVYNKPQIVSAH